MYGRKSNCRACAVAVDCQPHPLLEDPVNQLVKWREEIMSSHASSQQKSTQNATNQVEPRPLELSLNPVDGSLLTIPLAQVLLASTDALYQDLYNMAHGELDVTTSAQSEADLNAQEEENSHHQTQQTRRERMSNLSFAQRRHELAWRLAQHGRAMQHVAGLTAGDASSDFSRQVQVSSKALQHARTAWVQADEAQDAMYFFHAQLFPARAAPHDVYGAMDVHLAGKWYDLPSDLRLAGDRYETARESEFSRAEVDERWQMAVHEKLLSGEVAWMKQQGLKPLFNLSLRGGVLELRHGSPRRMGSNAEMSYPIKAVLTVVSSSAEADEWTLLSLDVRVQAKTGEFNHQLEASNRQRYDLHRLAALAMSRDEARVAKLLAAAKASDSKDDATKNSGFSSFATETTSNETVIARPLHALFQVAQIFSLSWQLELLSAQALALRRGAWSAGEGNQINVTPVKFVDAENDNLLGAMSISFWRVDDVYGPPSMGDLITMDDDDDEKEDSTSSRNLSRFIDSQSQLVLSIRAEKTIGIRVALSGGSTIRGSTTAPHTEDTIRSLLEACSNPFSLSASDGLLAATRLCTERKCEAAVHALQSSTGAAVGEQQHFLPPWITLRVERGDISICPRVLYHGVPADSPSSSSSSSSDMPVLFRLACDARTGSFAPTFPRAMKLLRFLACNDVRATESVALRIANTPVNRRRAAGAKSTGLLVKEAFDGLVRSMNVLGQRVGMGGKWDDKDGQSASIRFRSIGLACRDVTISMTKCCGLAALFGLTPIAIGTALGLNACPDMAGEALERASGIDLFPTPPLSIMLDQQVIESSKASSDGVSSKKMYLEQTLFALSFSCSSESLTLYPMTVSVHLDTPSSVPIRKSCSVVSFRPPTKEDTLEPPQKRLKSEETGDNRCASQQELDFTGVVDHYAGILSATLLDGKQNV